MPVHINLDSSNSTSSKHGRYWQVERQTWLKKVNRRPFFAGPHHQVGLNWAKQSLGFGPQGYGGSGFLTSGQAAPFSLLGRMFGVAFTGYSAYEGYKQDGIWGAVKGAASSVAQTYIMGRALSAFGPAALGIAGTVAMTGVLGNLAKDPAAFSSLRGWVRGKTHAFREKHRGVQFGSGPTDDPFGQNATMRQRSLAAIQESRLNARLGLGQEAAISWTTPYR